MLSIGTIVMGAADVRRAADGNLLR